MLADLLNDDTRSPGVRWNACWALTQLQGEYAGPERKQLLMVWMNILRQPTDKKVALTPVNPAILTPTVRAVGLYRNPDHAKLMEHYTTDPTPSVRRNAAIALGRMGNQESRDTLLKMIGEREKNLNVRLAARKALQALAGGLDDRYDVEMWKNLFARKK
jgi:HEAT repeat protein